MSDIRELLDRIEKRADVADEEGWNGTKCYRPVFCGYEGRRLVAVLRAVLKVVEDMPHSECEDSWYSCSQATDPYTGEFTCANDNRAGEPCDCTKQWLSDKVDNAITEAMKPWARKS